MPDFDDLPDLTRRGFIAAGTGLAALAAADTPRAAARDASSPPGWEYGPFDDLRSYVAELERRNLVIRVRNVDQDNYEATALFYRLVDKCGWYDAPVLVFENVKIDGKWVKGPLIANQCGPWDTECITFGIEPVPGDGRATYRRALNRVGGMLNDKGQFPTAPFRVVDRDAAPCKQVMLRGDQIDITQFAFIQSNPGDAGRYINTGSVFTVDSELGKNFGTYRCQIRGPRLLGVNPEPGQGAYRMFMKKRERGEKSCPVSIALGQDPITWVVSGSKLARGQVDELELVSGIRGRPLDVVKSETNDMLIPANAEMVIEGDVPLDQPGLPEGPFGEMYGYLGRAKDENFFMNVTCITYRRNPWLINQFTGAGRGFPTAPLEELSMTTFRRFVPNVVLMHSPVETTGLTFISIRKQKPGQALEIGKRVAEIVGIAKVVVVVDEDIDVLDRTAVMHAVGSRWQPQPATLIIPEARGMPLDPSLTKAPNTSKIVIDATRQWPEEGGPKEYQPLNRALLEQLAPNAIPLVDANWSKLVGRWRPPGS
jgi:UbiD family decarboxylase